MSFDSENSSKAIKHINQMRFGSQNKCYLYFKVASTKFGYIGFNFKSLQGDVKSLPKHLLSPKPWIESHEWESV